MGKIKVTAGEGRTVPLPAGLANGPGGTLVKLVAGEIVEIDDSHHFTQRALRNGDLVRVPDTKKGT